MNKYYQTNPGLAQQRIANFDQLYDQLDKDWKSYLDCAVLTITGRVHNMGTKSAKELIMAILEIL